MTRFLLDASCKLAGSAGQFARAPLLIFNMDGYSNNRIKAPLFVFADTARILFAFTSYLICLFAVNWLNSYKIENTAQRMALVQREKKEEKDRAEGRRMFEVSCWPIKEK
jgi:hypothetical protein